MKNSGKKYEEIVNQLRNTKPILPGKKKFAAEIITKIKDENQSSKQRLKSFVPIIRPAMTAAAIFLIGLFLFQQVEDSVGQTKTKPSINLVQKNVAVSEQNTVVNNEIPEELKACLKAAKSESKNLDRSCAIKLFSLYKKLEMQETKSYKQKIKNWFNH